MTKKEFVELAQSTGFEFAPSTKSLFPRLMPKSVVQGTQKLHNLLRDSLGRKVYYSMLEGALEHVNNVMLVKTSYSYWVERIPTAIDITELEKIELPSFEEFCKVVAKDIDLVDEQAEEKKNQPQQMNRKFAAAMPNGFQ